MKLNELISLHYRELTDNELIVCRHVLSHLCYNLPKPV